MQTIDTQVLASAIRLWHDAEAFWCGGPRPCFASQGSSRGSRSRMAGGRRADYEIIYGKYETSQRALMARASLETTPPFPTPSASGKCRGARDEDELITSFKALAR